MNKRQLTNYILKNIVDQDISKLSNLSLTLRADSNGVPVEVRQFDKQDRLVAIVDIEQTTHLLSPECYLPYRRQTDSVREYIVDGFNASRFMKVLHLDKTKGFLVMVHLNGVPKWTSVRTIYELNETAFVGYDCPYKALRELVPHETYYCKLLPC